MYENERELVAAAGRRLAEGGLVIGTAGNLSVRVGDHLVVTGSGTDLGALTPAALPVVDLDGTVLDGELTPTSELPLHLAIYRGTGARAVAHAHSPSSIAVGCTHDVLPPIHYMTVRLGGVLRVAEYATFGTPELADNVLAALDGRAAALMRNHGSVAYGVSISEACGRLETVEWLAEVYRRAAALGPPRLLSDDELAAAADQFTRLDYGR
ncbi:MAG: class II aldolase/adducin family protein [Actinophytocola sp.]|uniref:class II aldolase/adducin family protein n=1 Tax=Actinophytocola sp. TaxID=1872138 RepID=UPI00132C0349|nr:class II aldolase/adducin family protein [Actinophytocola sp.]MPZ83899.1 class II aldolase/adducin family protein [Actinophytocola sp.]